MFRFFIILIFFWLLPVKDADATHIRGGVIQILKTEGKTITFQFVGLRDRGSTIEFGGGVFDFGDEVFVERDFSITETSLSDEVSRISFTLSHTYDGPGSYTVSYEEEYRNADILHMGNSVNTTFYVETTFTIDPFVINQFPEITIWDDFNAQVGKRFQWAPQVVDPDGDLITYSLATPMQGRGMVVNNFRKLNAAEFYTDYQTGNQAGDGPPVLSMDRFTGNLTWDAPGDATAGGVREYVLTVRVSEWRKVEGQWFLLSNMLIDFVVFVGEEDSYAPVVDIPTNLCESIEPYILEITENTSCTLSVADVPFFQTSEGVPFSELEGLYIQGDTSFVLEVVPEVEEKFQPGRLEIVNEGTRQSFNILYAGDCIDFEGFLLITGLGKPVSEDIVIYPNPNRGDFKIRSQKNLSAFKIVTLSGKVLLEGELQNHSVSLGHSYLPGNGVYLIQFFDRCGRFMGVKRLVIASD